MQIIKKKKSTKNDQSNVQKQLSKFKYIYISLLLNPQIVLFYDYAWKTTENLKKMFQGQIKLKTFSNQCILLFYTKITVIEALNHLNNSNKVWQTKKNV